MQSTGPTTPLTASECRQMQGVCQSKKNGADSTEKLSQCGILQVFRVGCRCEFSLLPRSQRLHRLNCRQTCPRFMQGRTTNAKSAHHPHPQLANGHSQHSLGQRPREMAPRPTPHNWPTAIVNIALGNAQGKWHRPPHTTFGQRP